MRKFFMRMLSADEKISSKRFIAIIAFACMVFGFFVSMFRDVSIKDFIWDSMLYVTLGGLGITAIEKFSRKGNEPKVDSNVDGDYPPTQQRPQQEKKKDDLEE